MPEIQITRGDIIKRARLAMNLSQEELSEMTGISVRSLYSYEQQNKEPRKKTMQILSETLHIPMEMLTEESDDDNIQEKAEFTKIVQKRYRSKGKKEAEEILERAGALFAGGSLDEEAKEVFMQSLMQVYLSSKEEASMKFSRKRKK